MEDYQRIADLIARYQTGDCTEAERELVDRVLFTLDTEVPLSGEALQGKEEVWAALLAAMRDERPVPIRRFLRWIPYAAAVLLAAVVIGYFTFDSQRLSVDNPIPADILPGGNRATLLLDDGRTIELSSRQEGIVVGENIMYSDGTEILNIDERHKEQGPISGSPVRGNVRSLQLITPNGGMYRLTLSDGTKVWLNAASSLKYPSRFTGNSRVVELAGEGYFEVAEDKKMPFRVISSGQQVEVLGTAFNMSAYEDDRYTTTILVSGAVKVSRSENGGDALLLRPGEQALLNGGVFRKDPADVLLATSWKDGDFYFRNTPLKEMMSQLARWYDIETVYEGRIPEESFSGAMSRELTLQAVLGFLKDSGINFRIKGKQLFVYSK